MLVFEMTFQKYVSMFMDSKLSLRLIFAGGIALEITQKNATRTIFLYSVFQVIAVIAYAIFYVNWTVNMQRRLCDLLLTGCGVDFFFPFFSLTVLVSEHETYPSHIFVIKTARTCGSTFENRCCRWMCFD